MSLQEPIRLFETTSASSVSPESDIGRQTLLCGVASLLLFTAAAAWTWLSTPETQPPERLPKAPTVVRASPAPVARTVSFGPGGRLLVLPFARDLNRKRQTFLARPSAICDGLARDAGVAATPWSPAPVEGNGWECLIGPVQSTAATAVGEGSSLFIILRGATSENPTQLSLMVNLLHSDDEKALMGVAARLLAQKTYPEIALPPEVVAAFSDKRAFKQAIGGNRIEIIDEGGKGARLRLIARFAPLRSKVLPQGSVGYIASFPAFLYQKTSLPPGVERLSEAPL